MIAAIDACTSLYAQTGDLAHLRVAGEIADYLALFQSTAACDWAPAPYGAVASQNIGSRFGLATQADAAKAFADLYYLTDDSQYLDRSIAALRAGFGMIDPDHAGNEAAAAAMLAIADELHSFYGDAIINVPGEWGRGLGASFINNLQVMARTIAFDLVSPLPHDAPATVRFWQCPTEREVIVNGESLGIFTPAQLWQGVKCRPRRPLAMKVRPVTRCLAGVPVVISAQLTGAGRTAAVRLVCRRRGEGVFTEVAMTSQDGTVFSAPLPEAMTSEPGTVEYYVAAVSGCESAVEPPGAPDAASFTLDVTPELVITCGRNDEPYLDTNQAAPPKATELGRLLKPADGCAYSLPVPPGARAVRLEITREGPCEVYADAKPLTPDDPVGTTVVYVINDAALWARQRLQLRFEVPDGASAVLRRIKLTPLANVKTEE